MVVDPLELAFTPPAGTLLSGCGAVSLRVRGRANRGAKDFVGLFKEGEKNSKTFVATQYLSASPADPFLSLSFSVSLPPVQESAMEELVFPTPALPGSYHFCVVHPNGAQMAVSAPFAVRGCVVRALAELKCDVLSQQSGTEVRVKCEVISLERQGHWVGIFDANSAKRLANVRVPIEEEWDGTLTFASSLIPWSLEAFVLKYHSKDGILGESEVVRVVPRTLTFTVEASHTSVCVHGASHASAADFVGLYALNTDAPVRKMSLTGALVMSEEGGDTVVLTFPNPPDVKQYQFR
jgi:hypothetical protein